MTVSGGNFPLETITNANPAYLRHDLGDLTTLTRNIKREGLRAPVLIDPSYLILDGARRVEALRRLGADSVWCVVAKDWFVFRDQMLEAVARHEAGQIHLPKSYMDIVELMPYVHRIKRAEVGARSGVIQKLQRAAKLKEAGAEVAHDKRPDDGALVVASQIFATDHRLIRVLSMVAGRLKKVRQAGDRETEKRIIAAVIEGEKEGLVTSLVNAVDHAIDPSVRLWGRIGPGKRVLTNPLDHELLLQPRWLEQQKKTIDRTVDSFAALVQALPSPDEVASNHSTEDINRWLKETTEFTQAVFRFRRRLNQVTSRREHVGSE
jgi:hypothetical protein